jgi:Zn-finger nucleic acid-binding protein
MKNPLCPSCREQMSSVEQGLGGVWSCLYCEGVWLSQDRVKVLDAEIQSFQHPPNEAQGRDLLCPSCGSTEFRGASAGPGAVHRCQGCAGLFLEKGCLQVVAPAAISASEEAPVLAALVGALASAFALDPTLIIAALLSRHPRKNAA